MEESSSKDRTKLALFDFDGTLTVRDSMLAFIEFVDGKWSLYWSLLWLSPILILTKMGRYDAEKAKKALLKRHLGGMDEESLKKLAQRFCMTEMTRIFRDEGLEKLAFHRSKGHKVVIVSASLDLWIDPWLQEQNIMGICTEIAWRDGIFQGDFATPNCNGAEKARRIQAVLNLDDYERIFAYGDSLKGDGAMFALAHKVFYRKFM
jgi:phosphatidylglycerophosphatase C